MKGSLICIAEHICGRSGEAGGGSTGERGGWEGVGHQCRAGSSHAAPRHAPSVPSAFKAISRGRCCSVVELSRFFTTTLDNPWRSEYSDGKGERSCLKAPSAAPPAMPPPPGGAHSCPHALLHGCICSLESYRVSCMLEVASGALGGFHRTS